jgi:modified peptide precursor CbpA
MFMNTQSTRQNQAPAQAANQAATPQQAAVIALRKRCDADGVGLSHYILVDRKVAK